MSHRKIKTKGYFRLRKINVVVKYLTISDILVISGFGLIAPIFAVFITDTIEGGTLEVVGIASAIYLLAKSLGQIPIASVIDKLKGERDDFWVLLVGSILYSLVPLFYIIIDTPLHLYIVQFFYGLSTAITLPSWYAIFTRHIDKEHEGIEWGIYQTFVDLGSAFAASLGGFMAVRFGFVHLFVLVSIITFIGSLFLVATYKSLFVAKKKYARKK